MSGSRPATAVHALSFRCADKSVRSFALADLEAERRDPETFCWVDVEGPEVAVVRDVLHRFGADVALTDRFGAPEVLPRIVEGPDFLGFYLYEVEDPERHLDTSCGLSELDFVRLLLVLGDRCVVTYHARAVEAVRYVRSNCEESFRRWGETHGFLTFLFLHRCLYDYAHLNLANDNFLDHLEEQVLTGDRMNLAGKISLAGRNILTLKKLAASLHIVLMTLATKRSLFVSEVSRAFYNDMLQNAVAVRASIDSSRDLLDAVLAAIHAAEAERTSDIARVLTVVSTVVLPLTLIAGIYGMNFEHMPELRLPWAYFATLGAMGALGVAMLFGFWRLGWLRGGGGGGAKKGA
jgi:magnesium transporter